MGNEKEFKVTLHTYDQIENESITINVRATDAVAGFKQAADIIKKDKKKHIIILGGSIDLA